MRRALLAAALLAAGTAQAQERPLTIPSRDVDVTYRSEAGGQAVEQRSRFRAADQKLRIDTPTPGVYMLVDQRARTMAMVSDVERGVVDMTLQGSAGLPGMASADQSFIRRGTDQVAGLPCTEWETRDSRGDSVLACFTADGVMLRARQGTQVLVVASRVTYGPHDPALFVPPAGYRHTTGRGPR